MLFFFLHLHALLQSSRDGLICFVCCCKIQHRASAPSTTSESITIASFPIGKICEEEGFIAGSPNAEQVKTILQRLVGSSSISAELEDTLEKKVCQSYVSSVVFKEDLPLWYFFADQAVAMGKSFRQKQANHENYQRSLLARRRRDKAPIAQTCRNRAPHSPI